jgi:hypothetical protein
MHSNADALSCIHESLLERKPELRAEIDEERKRQILYEYHDAPLGGHHSMNKTYKAIKEKYSWPNMKQEIEGYVNRCKSCQVNKILRPRRKVPMENTTRQPLKK